MFRRHCRRQERSAWSGPALVFAAALAMTAVPEAACSQQATAPGGPHPAAKAGESEVAQRGQRAPREIRYGDWRKFCFAAAGTAKVCRTTISGTFETGQTAVRVDLIEREGDGSARLQLFLPVGMYLQAGVKLSVDQGEPRRIPYSWCLTNACIAADVADPAIVREMETGQKLQLEVVDSNILAIATSVPLNQFASVRRGAPAQTFDQAIDE
jgi:invasion protein IalB